jgi:iron complex outermembrane receptor protein
MVRDYSATGEEALSPPVDQNAFALFGLEELNFERVTLQLGGRIEYTGYTPKGLVERGHHHEEEEEEEEEPELVALPKRDFTGFSGSVGGRFALWESGAFVANYTNSYRAPALEELYNFGPHVGNLAFEIGDPNLKRERSSGIDLSLRHQGDRISGEATFFFYDMNDFVYLAPTGEIEDDLIEAEFLQRDSRFTGAEFRFNAGLHEYIWLNLGLDTVRAELSDTKESLPRIPPLRGRVGVDFRYRGLSVKPEVVMADSRRDVFSTETTTAGYTVVNLLASYSIPMNEYVHHFSFQIFNVGDRLYRNHVSFIKDFAPEIGRGVKFTYNLMFF